MTLPGPLVLKQNSPPHLALRTLGFLVLAYVALSPFVRDLKPNDYGEMTDIMILALAAISLNLLIGFTGQLSIGHSAFFGLGGYTTAVLMQKHGWSPEETFVAAALLCFVVGVLVGVPALRLTGVYLSLVTLALAQLFPALVRKFDTITGGSRGIGGLSYEPPSWSGLSTSRLDRSIWLYAVSLFFVVVGYVVMRNLVKSRVGRAMVAVRDNTTAAGVMGVNIALVKTIAFGISAAMAGVAGSVFVFRQTQANPDNLLYTILGAILFLVIMVIGGTGSLLGPIVGAFIYYRVNQFTIDLPNKDYLPNFVHDFLEGRANLATIVFAGMLILLMYLAPFGIVGFTKRVSRRVVLVVPKPPVTGADAPEPELAPDAVAPSPFESSVSSPTQGGPS
jgi:branched-chain amino acid transport system permease protein